MIDLTPLDVRKKRGDFGKAMRGYESQQVDSFLDLVAERMEELVRETMTLRERVERLQAQVDSQSGRERAVQEALVTAQSLREEMKEQARREADLARREAEAQARNLLADADRQVEERRVALEDLERKRVRFLRSFRSLLERELDVVVVEEGRAPLEVAPVELDLQGGQRPDEPRVPQASRTGGEAPDPRDLWPGAVAEGTEGRAGDGPMELWPGGLGDEARAPGGPEGGGSPR